MKKNRIISFIVSMCVLLSAVFVPTMISSAEGEEDTPIYSAEPVVTLVNFDNYDGDTWSNKAVTTKSENDVTHNVVDAGGQYPLPESWSIEDYKDGYAFKVLVYAESNMTFPAKGDRDWAIIFGQDLDNSETNNVDSMLRLAYGKNYYLTKGWNELYLPITSTFVANGNDGNWNNLTNITHIRVYDTGTESGPLYLNEVSIVKYTAPQTKYDAENGVLQLDAADDITPYENKRAMYVPNIKKEGAAAAFTSAGQNWIKRAYEPTDAHVSMEDGAIKLWLYVNAPDQIADMWFELKDADGTVLNYQRAAFGELASGWNEVTISLSLGTVNGGETAGFDTSKITYSHLEVYAPLSYSNPDNPNERIISLLVGIDDLRIIECSHEATTDVEGSAKDATCTAAGKEYDQKCTACGHVATGAVINALGHSDDNDDDVCDVCGVIDPDAYTVTLTGENEAVEGKEYTVTINANGAPGFASAEMTVTYDASRLQYVGIRGLGTPQDAVTVDSATDGTLKISDFGDNKNSIDIKYTITFNVLKTDAVEPDTTTEVALTAAAFSTQTAAENYDLTDVTTMPDPVSVTIREAEHTVELPEIFDGDDTVEDNTTYTFTATDNANYTYENVTATMDGEPVTVNGDQKNGWTIENVTGDLVISGTRYENSYEVTVDDSSKEFVTGNAEKATYNTDYTFEVPVDKEADTTPGWKYNVTVTIGDNEYVNYTTEDPIDGETVTYKIPGKDITGEIIITVVKTTLDENQFAVRKSGSGAEDLSLTVNDAAIENDVVNLDDDILLTLIRRTGFDYVVTVNGTPVMEHGETEYTIENVDATVDIVVTRTVHVDGNVETSKYVTLDGKEMWLVTIYNNEEGNEQIADKVYTYDGKEMYWSSEYKAYCTLVIGAEPMPTADDFNIVDGNAKAIVYDLDVNMSGNVDTNDAQLVYNMYNVGYDSFTGVTMEKFLRADLNYSRNLNVEDAQVIINDVLGLSDESAE